MRPVALVVFSAALLGLTGVQAATRSGDIADTTPVTKMQTGVTQVAESNSKSPNKLRDKYLDGKAGGFYGIGGSEPHVKYFKSRMKKIPPCCGSSH